MKVDTGINLDLRAIPNVVKTIESQGYDGVRTAEMNHDPFFPLLLAAEHSEKLEIASSIAVAFARSPMNLANIGHDLNAYSKGRFTMGLGSQIKPHITKRFSMEWSKPAARMREMILATKAIWNSWNTGEKLDFRGDFYQHTLMTPFFDPGENPYGAPRMALAGVGPLMTEVAGETCDVFLAHGFTTEKYLREETIPALERGAEKAGRSLSDVEISGPLFVVTGNNEDQMEAAKQATKQQIAFYGSTPAYKPVLESIGVGAMQGELNTMSKQGRWQEMGELITDDILESFAVVAEPDQVADQIISRYGDIVDRTSAAYAHIGKADRASIIEKLSAI